MKVLAIMVLVLVLSGCAGLVSGAGLPMALGGRPTFYLDGEINGAVRWNALDRVALVRGKAEGKGGWRDEKTGLRQEFPVSNPDGVYWIYNAGSFESRKFNEPLPAWIRPALNDEDVAAWGVQFAAP